ncbi:MAG: NAD(P)-dependent oxidoreductase [Bacteroidetes bacterium]|nr:NAD(P)-dependent oxidoreductase [Bacteroidota bacterium]
MTKSCLIIDKMHNSIVPLLEGIGYKVDYCPQITRSEIIERITTYTGIIIRSKTNIDREILKHATNLRFVARAGAGLDMLEMDSIKARDIKIINAPEGNRDALAEHALGMLLNLLNNINKAADEVRRMKWDREGNSGSEIMGKSIGILGYGFMGRAFALRLSGFACKILAYDKYITPNDPHVEAVSMDRIFQDSDVFSIHLPLTDETYHLIDESFLDSFQKEIVLLNTSRGGILKQEALIRGLKTGKIKGAALDVLENEKLNNLSEAQKENFEFLSSHQGVLLTPHIAGWTVESYEKINQVLVDKIKGLKF